MIAILLIGQKDKRKKKCEVFYEEGRENTYENRLTAHTHNSNFDEIKLECRKCEICTVDIQNSDWES